jgi:hypothetical protein
MLYAPPSQGPRMPCSHGVLQALQQATCKGHCPHLWGHAMQPQCHKPPPIIIIIKLHIASQIIVPKQQINPGAKRTPPGKPGRALQLPRACAGCGCFTT